MGSKIFSKINKKNHNSIIQDFANNILYTSIMIQKKFNMKILFKTHGG
jgi:hypothetical protein